MIGMNATIMTNAEIGEDSVVGANSLVPYEKKFPPRSFIIGLPARLVRELKKEELGAGGIATRIYEELKEKYSDGKIIGFNKL